MHNYTFNEVKQCDEYKSFLIRFGLGLGVAIFCGVGIYVDIIQMSLLHYFTFAFGFFFIGLLFFVDLFRTLASPIRRYITLCFDISSASVTIILTSGDAHVIWLCYIWLFIGYGSRYGEKYMFFAQKMTIFQYVLVVYITDIWIKYPLDLGAQLLALILLPKYMLSLTNQLQQAKQVAENLAQLKSNFLTSMSHEIRTPLNGIIGTTLLLNKTSLDEQQQQYSKALLYSSELLLALINNILDIAKIEANKFQINQDQFSIKQTIERVIESFLYFSNSKGLKLSTEIDPNIPELLSGDKQRTNQILINLIGNAIKFTEQGEVKLMISIYKSNGNQLTLQGKVSDTGIGISPKDLEHVFEQFSQFNQNSNEVLTGTGLGMSITKELIEIMGGSISVSSEVDYGSEFTFTLPFSTEVEKTIQLGETQATAADDTSNVLKSKVHTKALTIFIAEDDDINAMILTQFLTDLGHQCSRGRDGADTLKQLESKKVDLIFMDLHMPDMTGIEVTQVLRKSGFNLPIIGLTANATVEQKQNCLNSGMNDFMTKPVMPENIAKAIVNNVDA